MKFHYKIYYEDTDAAGVVYFANYLKFLERAKTDLMGFYGINIAKWHRAGTFLAVRKGSIRWIKPAELGDILTVDVEFKSIKKASIQYEYSVYVEKVLYCTAQIDTVIINKDKKPAMIPAEWKKRLKTVSLGDRIVKY